MGYVHANASEGERQRLGWLEAAEDPDTICHLQALGVETGWRCLEVGGGGGSIAAWLCRRVGPSGAVVATDVDPRFLEALDLPNLEVWRHDVTRDLLPEGAFDLVHARWLLHHLAEPAVVLHQLAAALKPGGWLLVEEPDLGTVSVDARGAADEEDGVLLARFVDAMAALVAAQGGDCYYGRQLYWDLRAVGLEAVNAEARARMASGGSPDAEVARLTLEQLRNPAVATGTLHPGDVDAMLRLFADPNRAWRGCATVAAWGRRR